MNGLTSQHRLQAEELLQIGVSAVNQGYYDTGVEWLLVLNASILQHYLRMNNNC